MFDDKGRYIIKDYQKREAFSSFLPGISGMHGVPIWCFYVNRGQAVACFGSENKNHSIMEFMSAYQAYQMTEKKGFRTFLRIDGQLYEAFRNEDSEMKMYIGMNELEIEETNNDLGIKIRVLYYTLPQENVGGLVRSVSIQNISLEKRNIEVLDGMPEVIPYGIELTDFKEMARTMEAWMQVEMLEDHLPYYHVRFSTKDSIKVSGIEQGNYLVSVDAEGKYLPVIVDTKAVFDYDTSLSIPLKFREEGIRGFEKAKQIMQNQVPCGFVYIGNSIEGNKKIEFNTVIGYASCREKVRHFISKISEPNYFKEKYQASVKLTDELGNMIGTKSADKMFDAYCKQTYLDNVLRGGYPVQLGNRHVFYAYSRKHGDLERDYNFFSMLPEYYSQGNGNFRDVNQNRRSDIRFSPFTEDYSIKLFYNLIQLDGYNPLVINQVMYKIEDVNLILEKVKEEHQKMVSQFFEKNFSPGQLFLFLEQNNIQLKESREEFFDQVLYNSSEEQNADFSEGYWTDHWTYNLDLIESYEAIYPDKMEQLLFNDNSYTYYESKAVVLPRKMRYVKTDMGIRQYHCIDEERKRDIDNKVVRTTFGSGKVYSSSLMTKLVILAANKFASLDLEGMGIEMEAGKPGWYDALNGLPGMVGSSMSETYELYRMLKFMEKNLKKYHRDIRIPDEVYRFVQCLTSNIYVWKKDEKDCLWVWNRFNQAKEEYRESTVYGIEGHETVVTSFELIEILNIWSLYVEAGIQKACDKNHGLPPTYFAYDFLDVQTDGDDIVPVQMKEMMLPLFLEGPVRYFKLLKTDNSRKVIYQQVKRSDLYDRKLQMYKVNASLEGTSYEIGRARAFSAGWLENESIWLHMEYKYLLELLKGGLYEEYFEEFKKTGIPFMSYEKYGRSPLENSSFLVSSANENESLHGKGFVARLSGSTAEFLQMWQIMMFGDKLFSLQNGILACTFTPAIPQYLIPENGIIECMLFGKTKVIYHFTESKDIVPTKIHIARIILSSWDDMEEVVSGETVYGDLAKNIRECKWKKIDIFEAGVINNL